MNINKISVRDHEDSRQVVLTSVQEAVERLIKFFGGQAAAGRAIGVSQPSICRWRSGKTGVDAGSAFKAQSATSGAIKAWELCLAIPRPEVVTGSPANPDCFGYTTVRAGHPPEQLPLLEQPRIAS